jgi:5-methyltetrahydrofolate--homocysteine methyltransferase
MGTMIQGHQLEAHHYRGDLFHDHACDLKGNNDLLTLTQPGIIRTIHGSTWRPARTSSRPTLQLHSHRHGRLRHGGAGGEMNVAGARLAREVADEFERATPGKPRFVAGVIGPTNRTASISPDVNDPGFRNVTFDELVDAYTEAGRGLIDGGADLLMVETVFDTLNAKAALFAIEQTTSSARRPAAGHDLRHHHRPLRPHALGQTAEAFWNSVAHAKPIAIGLNCALGRQGLRQHIEELAQSPTRAHQLPTPTPACPTRSAATTSRPSRWPGCCASSPRRD